MRVEPKSYFANERTFLSWASMATTMGGVSSALMGFTFTRPSSTGPHQLITGKTIDIISCVYTPVAILIILYALFTYEWRSRFMRKKHVGFFDDKVGPITLAVIVFLSLTIITILGFIDFFF